MAEDTQWATRVYRPPLREYGSIYECMEDSVASDIQKPLTPSRTKKDISKTTRFAIPVSTTLAPPPKEQVEVSPRRRKQEAMQTQLANKQQERESRNRILEVYRDITKDRQEVKKDPKLFEAQLYQYVEAKVYSKNAFGLKSSKMKILEVDDLLAGIFDIEEAEKRDERAHKHKYGPKLRGHMKPKDETLREEQTEMFTHKYAKKMTKKSIKTLCDVRRTQDIQEQTTKHYERHEFMDERVFKEKVKLNMEMMKSAVSTLAESRRVSSARTYPNTFLTEMYWK